MRLADKIGLDVVKLMVSAKEQSVMEISGTYLFVVKSLLTAVRLITSGVRLMCA